MAGPYTKAIHHERMAPQNESAAFEQVRSFDPYSAVKDTAQSSFNNFRRGLSETLKRIRASQAGMGRVGHGFSNIDDDEAFVELGNRFTNDLLGASERAAAMDMANRQYTHGAAAGATNRYYDLLGGQRDYEIAAENARRERRGGLARGIGAILGGTAGFFLGGGLPGAAAGARMGGEFGNIFA